MKQIFNFRQYILSIKSQLKKDREITKNDISKGKKKGLDDYQKGFYDGHVLCLKQIYNDCKIYEWIKR